MSVSALRTVSTLKFTHFRMDRSANNAFVWRLRAIGLCLILILDAVEHTGSTLRDLCRLRLFVTLKFTDFRVGAGFYSARNVYLAL